ncbi:transporter substrate-binding domain-containing protein [Oscillospiraceae bacterium PP1C4]
MKKMLALTLAAMLLMTGCGAKSETPAAGGSSTAESTATTGGKFVVGMECNYAPFNWTQIDKNDTTVSLGGAGNADGYDVVMAKAIADGLGKELEIKKIAWEGLEPALSSGEIDAIIAGMTDTPERRQNAEFTTPYYESDMVVIVRADDPLAKITSIQDLSGKKVLGQMSTLYDEVIDQIKGVTHATPLASYPLMVVALQNKEVDALTAELPVARGVVSSNPGLTIVEFEKGKGFEADTSVSIAVKKGSTELRDKIQGVLDGITEEQRLQWMTDATARQPAQE